VATSRWDFSGRPQPQRRTVRQFLAIVNTPLGGGSATYSIAQLNPVTDDLNRSFDDGAVSAFARDHLVNGGCPP